MGDFIKEIDSLISERKKMTNPLYQVILEGEATQELLQNFIIHRYPVKNVWTRHLLSIASRVDDYDMRCKFLENAYEEETGFQTNSKRHLESFVDVGLSLGLERDAIVNGPIIPETKRLVEHNINACNNTNNHFTVGVASVIYLIEAQPPIVNTSGSSMESVMRDVYHLPQSGYEYFTHHASSSANDDCNAPSELEDTHSAACRELLEAYCTTTEQQDNALDFVKKSLQLRHEHFDAIYTNYYKQSESVFRHTA